MVYILKNEKDVKCIGCILSLFIAVAFCSKEPYKNGRVGEEMPMENVSLFLK